ncbi:MAG: hypothetical protein KAH93_02045 [Candidatus Aenigmarchaeota archaeon]|nr:hypothetical protein [Candidatus Aenigmarchaeota archaeon]
MTNKKLIILSIVVLMVIGIIMISFYNSKLNQIAPSTLDIKTKSEVTISTNKNDYNIGENINLIVDNGLEKTIFYSPAGDQFWGIEYFEDGIWKKFGYDGRKGFQLTDKIIGDNCYIAQYEQVLPMKLKSKSNLTTNWNQRICPFGTENPTNPRIVRYIESGKYRLTFRFGFELYDNDQLILEPKIVYSNTFTIK